MKGHLMGRACILSLCREQSKKRAGRQQRVGDGCLFGVTGIVYTGCCCICLLWHLVERCWGLSRVHDTKVALYSKETSCVDMFAMCHEYLML